MKSLILLLLLTACAAKPVDNPALFAKAVAKPTNLQSLERPGFY